ncbi:heavy metal sensor histidine kinase [Massilia yuzhufengensis]|uniref:Sensor protein n=1 Tax=Massilia yuzhufengensis TaxID=1164594 RepID=A0A1I1VX21_9BURK|nr:heavy metal sensor histidine kinase [Massilia yuzhufengensis]SFD87517.1 two-component system, OmpR family, heavy metal sensor histidine kinase CusS [Massilia yuzhufengensis]
MKAVLRHSLALRVAAMFMLVVVLAAAGLGAYLYRAFVAEIERRDDIHLLGKLRQVQVVLARPGAAGLLRTEPDFFRDTMSGQENSLVRIVDAGGAILADINPGRERYPVPAAGSPIAGWVARGGAPGRVVAGSARLGDAPVTVVVARAYSERSAMFARYRERIGFAALVGALLAAALALLLLRRGLRPLRKVAGHAALVRPGALARRLDIGMAPSELWPLIEAFNAMLGRLEEGYARLSGFSADLAHEFRTPVANMIGQSQVMLAQARSRADYETLVVSNLEELERLARMIDSMLFLARAHQEEVILVRQPLSALDELQRVADFFEGMAEERGIVLACSGDARVQADPSLLRRALANLVSNALRHADAGSVVALEASRHGDSVELRVSNHGVPVAPEHLAHLFERFYRADASRSEAEGSTGLGLSIVSAIMQLHGGAASVQAEGALVRFTLAFPAPPTW